MSEKLSAPSSAEDEQPQSASVFDFLYYDPKRVKSFLSQFQEDGTADSVRRQQSSSSTSSISSNKEIHAGPRFASVNKSTLDNVADSAVRGLEIVYDPFWANALELLNHLESEELYRKSLRSSEVGNFVLVDGALSIIDAGLMRAAWDQSSVQRLIFSGMNSAAGGGKGRDRTNTNQLTLDMLKLIPHPVQGLISNELGKAWFPLDPHNLTIPPEDIFLKHGTKIPGTWYVVGILDAKPDDKLSMAAEGVLRDALGTQRPDSSAVWTLVDQLGQAVRQMVGRPPSSHGMTPLLIFREVTRPQ